MKLRDENRLKTVISSRFVVNEGSSITAVFYDEDGDWQLFSDEPIEMEDTVIVSVQQILEIDNTLLNLPELEAGESAQKESRDAEWIISRYN